VWQIAFAVSKNIENNWGVKVCWHVASDHEWVADAGAWLSERVASAADQ
jgi:hypothetical protein